MTEPRRRKSHGSGAAPDLVRNCQGLADLDSPDRDCIADASRCVRACRPNVSEDCKRRCLETGVAGHVIDSAVAHEIHIGIDWPLRRRAVTSL